MIERSETQIQTGIIDILSKARVWVIRMGRNKRVNANAKLQPSGEDGSPDLWTDLGWIEVKKPGEDLDPDQVIWHNKAKMRGVRAGVAHSESEALALVMIWRSQNTTIPTGKVGI